VVAFRCDVRHESLLDLAKFPDIELDGSEK
jgi:hypothetical protein